LWIDLKLNGVFSTQLFIRSYIKAIRSVSSLLHYWADRYVRFIYFIDQLSFCHLCGFNKSAIIVVTWKAELCGLFVNIVPLLCSPRWWIVKH
jgi:hypothetical protein